MAAQAQTVDLGRLALAPGQGRRLELTAHPGSLELGGSEYRFHPQGPARLDVSRTASGHAMRLRFAGELAGPCMRCLGEARLAVEVEAREVSQPAARDEELTSPYVADGELDLTAWARDALALALPDKVLCRPDCAGLCPVCGVSLNDVDPAEHRHEPERDPRWAALDQLRGPGGDA